MDDLRFIAKLVSPRRERCWRAEEPATALVGTAPVGRGSLTSPGVCPYTSYLGLFGMLHNNIRCRRGPRASPVGRVTAGPQW